MHLSDKISFATLTVLSVAFLLGSGGQAFAQATSLGAVICNAVHNTQGFANIFQYVAWGVGAICCIQGVHLMRKHIDNPNTPPMSHALMYWAAASCLLALPSFISMVITSVYGTGGAAAGGAMTCTPGTVAAAAGSGLDVMMTNFVGNIKAPLLAFVSIIAMASGLYMIIHGLIKASKHGIDPRTHSLHHILINILFGALLISIGNNLSMMTDSLFGTTTISPSSAINWSFASTIAGGASTQFQNAITAALTFFQLIGAIAFVRGWMVMKKVAEGGGNVTMAQGITHILGGVLAINIFAFLKIMDTTFGTGIL